MAGFTLVELLVVVLIIFLLSVVALPAISSAINHRQVSEGARILQGALAGARDQAIHDNVPAGIRLLPDPASLVAVLDAQGNEIGRDLPRLANGQIDPAQPLVYNRIVPLGVPAAYAEGLASIYPKDAYPTAITAGVPALVLEESPGYWQPLPPPQTGYIWLPNSPVSWSWNVRVGDRLQIASAGPWYTIIGPNVEGFTNNQQLFVNSGLPGTAPPLSRTLTSPDGLQSVTASVECLVLVNGKDDNGNGWIDEGWDGVDNNGDGQIDEAAEWTVNMGAPSVPNVPDVAAEIETWSNVLASGNTVNTGYTIERRPTPMRSDREVALPSNVVVDAGRSRLTVNKYTGFVDILLNPDGSVRPSVFYSTPSSIGMAGAFAHFWLGERADVGLATPKGEWKLLTVFSRTGQIAVTDNPPVGDPFTASQQGVR